MHITLHVKNTEWGQKKIHLYMSDWEKIARPKASIVFVKDHNTSIPADVNRDTYRAFWHPNLSYGTGPKWLYETPTKEKPTIKPSYKFDAVPTYQYIEQRGKSFGDVVQQSEKLPLQPRMASLQDGQMYTRQSPVVIKTFDSGKDKSFQWDYQIGKWTVFDTEKKKWVVVT